LLPNLAYSLFLFFFKTLLLLTKESNENENCKRKN
jgi:hypothetical protein